MNKLLIAAAGVALIASPAAAQQGPWGNQSYGQDAIAVWDLNAPVNTFCRLNANGGTPSSTVGASFTSGGTAGTPQEADGVWNLDIQNDANNTVQLSGGAVTYSNSQCNTPFNVTATSDNGGLYNGNAFTAGSAFVNRVDYQVDVKFGSGSNGVHVFNTSGASTATLIGTQLATSGDFRIGVVVPANPNAILLQGAYRDRLTVTMTPFIS